MKSYLLIPAIGLFLSLSQNAVGSPHKTGAPAPEFTGKTTGGETIKLSDYRGQVVLLDFWASWCAPCREEMPFLIDFYREHGKKAFQIIAINIDDKIENMEHFLSGLDDPPDFPILVDRAKEIPKQYDIEAMPTTLFIDKKGTVRFWHTGFKKSYQKQFRAELDELLKEK